MEIKYQILLNNTRVITPITGNFSPSNTYSYINEPLTIEEIVILEATYNSNKQFPTSLRELLFIAGKQCNVLDYGLNDTQEEMQADTRDRLIRYNFTITRPFFVIDVHRSDAFLFVYLDEGTNDPNVYQANADRNLDSNYPWLMNLQVSLSSFVNSRIKSLQNGLNPH